MEDKKMKLIIQMIVWGTVFITGVGYINIKERKMHEEGKCLEVIGVAVNEKNEPINGVEVKLFRKNEEMEWMEVTNATHHDHNFNFVLDVNEYYTIEVSKAGYVKRLVVISTQLPVKVSSKPIFTYGFEVTLFKEKKGMDDYYLDFPVALISYNKKSGVFENNYNYTHHIKGKIKAELDRVMVENMMNGKY